MLFTLSNKASQILLASGILRAYNLTVYGLKILQQIAVSYNYKKPLRKEMYSTLASGGSDLLDIDLKRPYTRVTLVL